MPEQAILDREHCGRSLETAQGHGIMPHAQTKQDVEIHPKGRVEGDICLESPLLTVLEGGSIDGTIKMAKKENTILSIADKAK